MKKNSQRGELATLLALAIFAVVGISTLAASTFISRSNNVNPNKANAQTVPTVTPSSMPAPTITIIRIYPTNVPLPTTGEPSVTPGPTPQSEPTTQPGQPSPTASTNPTTAPSATPVASANQPTATPVPGCHLIDRRLCAECTDGSSCITRNSKSYCCQLGATPIITPVQERLILQNKRDQNLYIQKVSFNEGEAIEPQVTVFINSSFQIPLKDVQTCANNVQQMRVTVFYKWPGDADLKSVFFDGISCQQTGIIDFSF